VKEGKEREEAGEVKMEGKRRGREGQPPKIFWPRTAPAWRQKHLPPLSPTT